MNLAGPVMKIFDISVIKVIDCILLNTYEL